MNAPSPSSLLPNPHYNYALIYAIPSLLFITAGVMLLVFGGHWFDGDRFLGVMAIIIGLIISIGILLERKMGRIVDGYLEAIKRGEVLAHWTYTPEEWRPFLDSETKRGWRTFLQTGIALAIGSLLGIAMLYFNKAEEFSQDVNTGLIVCGGTFAFISLLGSVLLWQQRREQRRLLAQRDNPPDTYLARDFAVSAGWFIHWGVYNASLKHLVFIPGEVPMIEYGIQGGNELLAQRVLVPKQLAAQGEKLAAELLSIYDTPKSGPAETLARANTPLTAATRAVKNK